MLGDRHNFDYQPRLHGDLAPYHILVDRPAARLNGVIDFGVASLGGPATDLGCLSRGYGESFVGRMQSAYPEAGAAMRRARFYAQAIELEWVLQGLKSGEAFWFAAHLGNARDIEPIPGPTVPSRRGKGLLRAYLTEKQAEKVALPTWPGTVSRKGAKKTWRLS